MSSTHPDETKYVKRRKQRRQKINRSIFLLGVSILVLGMTIRILVAGDDSRTKEKGQQLESARNILMTRKEDFGTFVKEGVKSKLDKMNGKLGSVSQVFANRKKNKHRMDVHRENLYAMDEAIITNAIAGSKWVNPDLLPFSKRERPLLIPGKELFRGKKKQENTREFFKVHREGVTMAWEKEKQDKSNPFVDFTKHSYAYPEKLSEPPEHLGDYPKLRPLRDVMKNWPQDDIDHPPTPFQEALIHFDFTRPEDVEAATKFRDAKLPFKFINVPEVLAAGEKWTDEYVASQYSKRNGGVREGKKASGHCQESSNNYFAFFNKDNWEVESMGLPPSRDNDFTFEKWAKHARFADSVGLDADRPHFYFQSGVDREERMTSKKYWTFISRDLPSFSSSTKTFFVFNPEKQKGIQCRFGERGVTAATHFDAGRNMIAMITGAKRYILSPPRECPKLGIVTVRGNASFRHSMLNFGHLTEMDNPGMPVEEREWMKASGDAMSLETVLKAGEVLYIPSHWFHYITSLQKSAQCNVRSGVDLEGDAVFGGHNEVAEMCNAAI